VKAFEGRKYEMLVRVRDFGAYHGHLFSKSTLAARQFEAVDAAVKALRGYAVDKRSTARAGTASRACARRALAGYVRMLRRTPSAMAADVPDLQNRFRLPARNDAELLTAGHQFVRDAEPLQSEFILHGMPATFLADLRARVDEFEAAVSRWNTARGDNAAARKNIETALAAGFAALRKLDAIVPNQLEDNEGTLANWKHERRVDWSPRRRRYAAVLAGAITSSRRPRHPRGSSNRHDRRRESAACSPHPAENNLLPRSRPART